MVLGKLAPGFMSSKVFTKLGARRKQVLVGPGVGLDNAVLGIGHKEVLVSTTDPLSFIPSIGAKDSAWLSIHLVASDLATSGIAPQYAMLDFNLPPRMSDHVFEQYWEALHHECKVLGVSIVGGHTGRYEGSDYTVIGGGSIMSICSEQLFLTPAMARSGDDLILTKGAAIETTAILTRSFPRTIRKALGPRLFELAWKYLRRVSTVRDALTAASVGVRSAGVSAMHDATEGGVVAALVEIAHASGLGLTVDLDQMQVSEETAGICRLFGIDPLTSLSEGSLVVATRPFATGRVQAKLTSQGIASSVIGQMVPARRGLLATSRGEERRIIFPDRDPYWYAFSKASARAWS